jgi:glycosyltransferase involved in cell wall biosynthesis
VRILFFGTFDARVYQRVRVLEEGFAALGDEVAESNVPLRLPTALRVRMLREPWLLPLLAVRLGKAWWHLWRGSRRIPPADAVVVGYLGHFDVHLARRLWKTAPIVLDHLVSAADAARDRGASSRRVIQLLERLDRSALDTADLACVDTEEQLALLPASARGGAVVVPVGASEAWFHAPSRSDDGDLRVIFFGSFTPLQGTPVLGEAVALAAGEPLRFTIIGTGQDYEAAREAASRNAAVAWIEWVEPEKLPGLVARHEVSLGIFGTGAKALRVVPTKVFQGAAAGAAVLTSDTPPQRRALAEAGEFVAPGDADALAERLVRLAGDRERVWSLRRAAYERAERVFRPEAVVAQLRARLQAETRG